MINRKTERILKVDKAGRVWTPLEQREAALDEFERSGMPASKLAERIGVKDSTFASWAHERRKQRGGADVMHEGRAEPAALKWSPKSDFRSLVNICPLFLYRSSCQIRLSIPSYMPFRILRNSFLLSTLLVILSAYSKISPPIPDLSVRPFQ